MSDFLLHLIEPLSACLVLSSDVCQGDLRCVNVVFFNYIFKCLKFNLLKFSKIY